MAGGYRGSVSGSGSPGLMYLSHSSFRAKGLNHALGGCKLKGDSWVPAQGSTLGSDPLITAGPKKRGRGKT